MQWSMMELEKETSFAEPGTRADSLSKEQVKMHPPVLYQERANGKFLNKSIRPDDVSGTGSVSRSCIIKTLCYSRVHDRTCLFVEVNVVDLDAVLGNSKES